MTGLTFPLSNLLLPVSNFLVTRSEKHKLAYSALQRTEQSGRRTVKYKTYFPSVLGLLLNSVTMFPFHLIQKLLGGSSSALVSFFEAKPESSRRAFGGSISTISADRFRKTKL